MIRLLRRSDILLALLVIIADQCSKYVVLSSSIIYGDIKVTSFFNLVLRFNTGVGFSLFNTWAPWQLLLLAGLILSVVFVFYLKAKFDMEKKAYMLLLAGAISNMTDRLHLVGVVDFLDFHMSGYHWPAFNIADMTIVLACGLLLTSNKFKLILPRSS